MTKVSIGSRELTPAATREATQSLCDVFTEEGDAGVISRLYTFHSESNPLYGKGQCALVVGVHVHGWYPISTLTF
jgi:hypothetical protein